MWYACRQRLGERPRRPGDIAAFGDRGYAQAREVQFVQQRGIERDHFLALQAVDHVARRLREVEGLQLFRDGVEAPQRAAVDVLIVAFDEPRR